MGGGEGLEDVFRDTGFFVDDLHCTGGLRSKWDGQLQWSEGERTSRLVEWISEYLFVKFAKVKVKARPSASPPASSPRPGRRRSSSKDQKRGNGTLQHGTSRRSSISSGGIGDDGSRGSQITNLVSHVVGGLCSVGPIIDHNYSVLFQIV